MISSVPTDRRRKVAKAAEIRTHCYSLLILLISTICGCHSQFAEQQQSLSSASLPLMNLISPQNINDLTQLATEFAAQAMKSNGQMIANSGPEVKPIPTNARPSEMLGQGLTNMLQPTRQFASLSLGAAPPDEKTALDEGSDSNKIAPYRRHPLAVAPPPLASPAEATNPNRALFDLAQTFLGGGGGGSDRQQSRRFAAANDNDDGTANGLNGGGGAANNMIGQAMRMLSGGFDAAASGGRSARSGGGQQRSSAGMMPTTLRQLFPGAERNFGIRQGDGCLPFLGEFMKMAYGNCVKRADEKTWDAWGKEINNALSGGKIDLLRASKETCKMGAEREQCGQLRKAISDCDILGSIQLASNLQRSVSRCDEISGLMDQNPGTILNQMNGLINGEVAQGLINNFLG
ncbi:hypothetical protein niasHT_013175 [Heterodera trifolii]|uniref:Secreted protein n=1 Tax=Heterodera trifolii TaxID=157864 RepID=A0ABD2K6U8_9BILA